MNCPYCNSILSKVIDKRAVPGKSEIRRRRECLKCSKRFTTYEGVAKLTILVVKKDGHKEIYNREKLRSGILKALEKRPSLPESMKIIEKIEAKIRDKKIKEIASVIIGKWVLSELKKIDGVAYLRFISVYRTFEDPKDFEKELKLLE